MPFAIVLKLSLSEAALAQPPYLPLAEWIDDAGDYFLQLRLNLTNFLLITQDSLYVRAYLNSVWIAAVSTFWTCWSASRSPTAWPRRPTRWRPLLLMLVILPFWTSFLIRVYAWIGILKNEGLLNSLLLWPGLISQPLVILQTITAVYIGIVYSYLPFMILPIYANLEKHDPTLIEAAVDLGCTPIAAFWKVTVPLAVPGIIAGCFLVFIPAVGEFVIPDLLGGSDTLMIGKVLWTEFFNNRDWPLASAVAVLLLLVLVVPIALFQRQQATAHRGAALMGRGFTRFTATALTLGFAFLYLPIVLLVIFSFNASKLVTVWGGFSLQWYAVMLEQPGAARFGLGHAARRRCSPRPWPWCSAPWPASC